MNNLLLIVIKKRGIEVFKRAINYINKTRPILIKETIDNSAKLFKGKTAIVCGGGTGIGKAIAIMLKNNGAKVIICGRNEHQIEGMESFVWDVSKINEIEETFYRIIGSFGNVDFIINSQGSLSDIDRCSRYLEVDITDFENTIKVNLESVYFICLTAVKYFKKNNIRGHILNICSTEGLKGCSVPYGISKTGVVSLTKGLGKLVIRDCITINGIAPGATATSMLKMDVDSNLRRDYIPSGRATTPNEIAKVAELLLSDVGEQMCGEIVVIDGGESLH